MRLSTIGAGEFNGRVRDGIGFGLSAITTRPAKDRNQRSEVGNQKTGFDFRASWSQQISKLGDRKEHFCSPDTDLRFLKWALINESDQAERAISTGKLNASFCFALTHPAYRRGGLPRLFRETSFRGGFPA